MSIIDRIKNNELFQNYIKRTSASASTRPMGNAAARKVFMDGNSAWKMKRSFVAFDVETTGLSPQTDRIIELGAILFENRTPTTRFSTLVDPGIPVPAHATRVNNITNSMLREAPDEVTAFSRLSDFLGEVLTGRTYLCAHNADFDAAFLANTLARLGYDADIRYVDTLVLSRVYVKSLPDHRLQTVADHFSIDTGNSHRACDDAETCGRIMCRLMDLLQ